MNVSGAFWLFVMLVCGIRAGASMISPEYGPVDAFDANSHSFEGLRHTSVGGPPRSEETIRSFSAVRMQNGVTLSLQCRSITLLSGTSPTATGGVQRLFFSTPGSIPSDPLAAQSPRASNLFNGELRPLQNRPGFYESSFVAFSDDTTNVVEIGRLSVKFTLSYGLPDFARLASSGNVDFQGVLDSTWPVPKRFSLTGHLDRPPNSARGTYSFIISDATTSRTVTGPTELQIFRGSAAYSRKRINQLEFSIAHTNLFGESERLNGSASFDPVSSDYVNVFGLSATNSQLTYYSSGAAFIRNKNVFAGDLSFDIVPQTPWTGYLEWRLEITDPNDSNTNGVPDLSDWLPGRPIVRRQPDNLTVTSGTFVPLNVGMIGADPFGFQWSFEGRLLQPGTNASVNLTNVQHSDAGDYAVTVTNEWGFDQSASAHITVIDSIRQPVEQDWIADYGFIEGYTTSRVLLGPDGGACVVARSYYGTAGALTKFTPSGQILWQRFLSGNDIAIDTDGNTYVTGKTLGAGREHWDCMTQKLDAKGNRIWEADFNGSLSRDDEGSKVVIDRGGNVLVAGYTGSNLLLLKYDDKGNRLWMLEHTAPQGVSIVIHQTSLAVDSNGNSLVAEGEGLIMVDPEGKILWDKSQAGRSVLGVAYDHNENPVVLFFRPGPSTTSSTFGVAKYRPAGDLIWESPFQDGLAFSMVLDDKDNIYFNNASLVIPPMSQTIKVDSDGKTVWLKEHTASWPSLNPEVLTVDSFGNLYLCGTTNEGTAAVILKLDSAGSIVGSALLPVDRSFDRRSFQSLVVDEQNNLFAAGIEAVYGMLVRYVQPPLGASVLPLNPVGLTGSAVALNGLYRGGGSPITYQWSFNGMNLPNRTNATLIITNLQSQDDGEYSVIITDSFGASLTATDRLTVRDSTFKLKTPVVYPSGPADVEFTGDTGRTYMLEVSDDLQDWFPYAVVHVFSDPAYFVDNAAQGSAVRFYRASTDFPKQ